MSTAQAVSNEQIRNTIVRLLGQIAPEADYDDLDPDANLQETLDIDSFDYLNMLIGVNEELDVEIPESDYGELKSLNDLVAYVAVRV